MKRLALLAAMALSGCCERDRSSELAAKGGRVVETRTVIGYTIAGYSDGTVGMYWDSPTLGFSTDAGYMHDVAVALEEVSHNAMQRKRSATLERNRTLPTHGGKHDSSRDGTRGD